MDPLILFVELSHYRVNSAFVLIAVMLRNSDHTVVLMGGKYTLHLAIYDNLSGFLIQKCLFIFLN